MNIFLRQTELSGTNHPILTIRLWKKIISALLTTPAIGTTYNVTAGYDCISASGTNKTNK
jgi:hypothetical protein